MNKKDIIQSTKIIILATMIAMGTSYALGTDWYEPGLLTNSPEVVNLGTAYQEKAGAFSANGLSSWADGYFFSDLKVGGTGASDADANLKVSGKVGINLDEYGATEVPTATLDVNGSVRARSLSLTENPGTTYDAQVCADADGKLIICPVAEVPDPGDGITLAVSIPYVATISNQSCLYVEKIFTRTVTGADTSNINHSWLVTYNDPPPLGTPGTPYATAVTTLTSADGDDDDSSETFKIRIYRDTDDAYNLRAKINLTVSSGIENASTSVDFGDVAPMYTYDIENPDVEC
ncbi:MAG: hypothetical protein KBB88_01605 [Candidatus Pacebacteria bacterium]|nr:hypothetical protein [Candidatus Paceibacterota bacterium]